MRIEEPDAEREERLRTGKIPKRRDRCANRGGWGGCSMWAPPGEVYCSKKCRSEARKRSSKRFVGGSICTEEFDGEGCEPTRNPRR